jgi:hypothetical protein
VLTLGVRRGKTREKNAAEPKQAVARTVQGCTGQGSISRGASSIEATCFVSGAVSYVYSEGFLCLLRTVAALNIEPR